MTIASGSTPPWAATAQPEVGQAVARTLRLGWRIGLRVWPLAVFLCLPAFLISRLVEVESTSDPDAWLVWSGYAVRLLGLQVLGAALLPSLIRSFLEAKEPPGLHASDLRGRLVPVLSTTIAVWFLELGANRLTAHMLPTTFGSAWFMPRFFGVLAVFLLFHLLLELTASVAVIERRFPLTAVWRSGRLSWRLSALLELFASSWLLAGLAFVPQATAWLVSRMTDAPMSMDEAGLLVYPAGHALAAPFVVARQALLYHRYRLREDGGDATRLGQDVAPA